MKLPLAAIACAIPLYAGAVEFEGMVGMTTYKTVGNGTWYQEGLPHKLDLNDAGVSLGLKGEITSWLDWHANYVWLGRVRTDAIATPDDANYSIKDKACIGECIAHSRFMGNGFVHGLALTLEPHAEYKGWRIGVLGGPFLYTAKWNVTVDNWIPHAGAEPRTINANHRAKLNFGYTVGVSVSKGPVSVVWQRYFNKPKSDEPNGDFPGVWRHTDMLSVRYTF